MVKGFSITQIALHWAVAIMIVFQLLLGEDMSSLWRKMKQGNVVPTTTAAWAHIIVGSLVLALVLWRLTLRFARGVPAAPQGESALLTKAGDVGHVLLYVLMIALPVTGLLVWFGGVTFLADIHGGILKVFCWC